MIKTRKKLFMAIGITAVVILAVVGAGLTTLSEHVENTGWISKTEVNSVDAGSETLSLFNVGHMTLDKVIVAQNRGMDKQEWVEMQGPVNVKCETVTWDWSRIYKFRDIETADLHEQEVLIAAGTGSETINITSDNYISEYGRTIWRYDP